MGMDDETGVERFWFRHGIAGEHHVPFTPSGEVPDLDLEIRCELAGQVD